MFRRGKRGQITVFVLLAIVILFAFMFLLFMKVFIEKERYTVMATQQVQDYISQNSLSIYVTSCIDSVTTEALIRASLQGGTFNFSNKTYGKDYVTYYNPEYNRTVNVSIAVTPNDNCSVVRNFPWEYPYPYTKLYPTYLLKGVYNNNSLTCKYSGDVYDYYSGFFGRNQLLKLCNWNGSNKIGSTNTSFGIKTCESGTYSNSRVTSIQQDMEHFIEKEVQKCINFTEVLQTSPSNITQAGAPKAFITFGNNGFNVRLQYPFIVTVRGRQPVKTFYDFGIEKGIRFKEVYDYSYFSLRTDVEEAGFNMLLDKVANEDLGKTYRNYDIQRNKSIDISQTDIVRIVDNGTKIDGKPLIFQFAIKNRRPALEFINEYSGFLDVDILASQNESLIISPQGYDPDDDDIEYVYGLWKEDYDEYFNYSDNKCTGQGGQIVTLDYVRVNCSIKNWSSQPKNFTNSTLFVQTGKDAEYMPTESDMGFHVLNVSIKELGRQNLTDWQIIKIFIFDNPRANITATNRYGFPDNISSIEDPYILNGINSVVGLSEVIPPYNNFSSFVWNDSRGEFEKEIYISVDRNKTLYLPVDVNGTGSNAIGDIKKFVFNKTGLHNITLRVNTYNGFFDVATIQVDVKLCLPYRNNTNFAYPYNTGDPYFANHTCCTDATYDIKTGTSVCFTNTRYGANVSFDMPLYNYWITQPVPPNSKQITFNYLGGRADNDIFRRTFSRNCDGTRGNICVGTATETRTVTSATAVCNDNNYGTGGQNRCSGPPLYGSGFMVSTNALQCVNYAPGTTFELRQKTAQGLPVNHFYDQYCNNDLKCSSPGVGNYGDNGLYLCKAYCSGNGQCTNPALCTCSSTCGVEPLCDGVSYGMTRDVNTCSEGLRTYIADSCVACARQDRADNVCRGASFDSSCTAPTECDNVPFGGAATTNNYQWCNNQCMPQTCPNFYAYSGTGSPPCHTTCTEDSHCAGGYSCCTADMIANNACSALGSCFIYVPVVP